ncbi:MAG: DNA-binding protein [Candidatus Omnitrophica bacterium]|jgi:hypothetical protein|nr:DNA-binding protein [Candidatus Omnitrophota bacterium]
MKNYLFFMMLCLMLAVLCADCYAQVLTSMDLINNAKEYEGKIVSYKGEVIGDIMIRKDYAWVHVNDGVIAIGIWVPKAMVQNIQFAGDYQKKGDIVEVSGTFHRACREHGGDLDIHASGIIKIASGSPITHPLSRKKVNIAVYSLVLVLLFYALSKFLPAKSS